MAYGPQLKESTGVYRTFTMLSTGAIEARGRTSGRRKDGAAPKPKLSLKIAVKDEALRIGFVGIDFVCFVENFPRVFFSKTGFHVAI